MCVQINLIWSSRIHLQIPRHMHHDKPNHEQPRYRDDPLPADGGKEHGFNL